MTPVDARAAHLVESLKLEPHPEGGYYRQVYRSTALVQPDDERPRRSALTTIYFLLPGGECSRWHMVTSDEVWHFYEGAPLELFLADPSFMQVTSTIIGHVDGDSVPAHVVPAHHWQAARTTGAYTLVGCTVGPGFEFADFTLLRDHPAAAERLRDRHPSVAAFV